MIKYIFRDDEPLRIKAAGKADPQVIGEALQSIMDKEGDVDLPRRVVDAARQPDNPLHVHFEWDDQKAAEAHRREQASNLIRLVRVIDDTANDGTTPAFTPVRTADGIRYKSISDIRGSLDLQMAVLRSAQRDLEAFQKRYREMADICDLVEQAKVKLMARMNNDMETRAAA